MKTAQIAGEVYLSVSQASEMLGYSRDYIGQLCRSGSLTCKRSSGQWFILEENVISRTNKYPIENSSKVPVPVEETDPSSFVHKVKAGNVRQDALVFDGEEYVTSARAAELTGYAQDYVGELARTKEISARKVGRHWLVHKKEILAHKRDKDALLAHVQAGSAGFSPVRVGEITNIQKPEITTKYFSDDSPLLPQTVARPTDQGVESGSAISIPGGASDYFPRISAESYKIPIHKDVHTSSNLRTLRVPVYNKNIPKNSISVTQEDKSFVKNNSKIAEQMPSVVEKQQYTSNFATFVYAIAFFVIMGLLFVFRSNIQMAVTSTEAMYNSAQKLAWYSTISDFVPGRLIKYESK